MRAVVVIVGVLILAATWERQPQLQWPIVGLIATAAIVALLIWIPATLLSNHYARERAAAERAAKAEAKKKSSKKLQFVEVDIETGELQ